VTATLFLTVLAISLAWPVPILLTASRWPARSPALALLLWQSIALAGGLSMIGALLSFGLGPLDSLLAARFSDLAGSIFSASVPSGFSFLQILALGTALLLVLHLVLNLTATFLRAERQRRRHYHLIDLLSKPLPGDPKTRVLDHAAPVAYCLPGATRSATVLSAGLLRLLNADQLRAVIAHERAHLLQRHHLVLLAFKSWHSALPWFPIANRAENAVALLVEMLADDQARRLVDDRTLATAIALVGFSHQPGTEATPADARFTPAIAPATVPAPDQPFDMVTPRVERLVVPVAPLPKPARFAVVAAATLLLLVPTATLFLA
jgi:Zn-dependent protease with chaperone function